MVLLLWLGTGIGLIQDRQQTLRSAQSDARRTAELMENQVQRMVETLSTLARVMNNWLSMASERPNRSIDGLAGMVTTVLPFGEGAVDVRLFDATGRMIPFAGAGSAEINVADRDFFSRAISGAPEPVVGVPLVARDTGRVLIPFAYRAVPNRFGVTVIALGVRADMFTRLYGESWLERGAAASVARSDGVLLARQPELPGLIGANILDLLRADSDIRAMVVDDFYIPAVPGREARLGSSRAVPNTTLIVGITVAENSVLAAWKRRLLFAVLFATAGTTIITSLVWWIIRLLRQREIETQRLMEAYALASAANQAKTEFLAKMSHELRTPMNAIIGFAETMRDQMFGGLSQRYREYSGHIHDSGLHLLSLINDVLDLSRIESGRHELRIEPVMIDNAVTRVLTATGPLRRAKDLQVIVDGASGGLLMADSRALHQMLVNLLSNAIKFSPHGGTVRLSVVWVEKGVELVVEDQGPGIAVEDLDRVFEPFGRGSSLIARQTEGLGLGLPITRSLIEAHGGQIVLETAQGGGLKARLIFPLHTPTASSVAA